MRYFKLLSPIVALTYFLVFPFSTTAQQSTVSTNLKVYKTPTCGCCSKWLAHLDKQGLDYTAFDLDDLSKTKKRLSILPRYQSCHTGVSEHGYIFEGHVPAKFIQQFISTPVEGAIGLSVPAMPLGSVGMEFGKRFHPYQVLVLMKDGSAQIYAEVKSYEEQF
ncbi:DUF411 domain-containing protein [Pseudoalteromonas luteoviolacea]|uniref:DUF411 domain-containing protein n=1 Tax=Pseudoalteromonas luteoviolacea TaxID=43657 RepID=UPI001154555B|nr:DUF411 domain-containing protein [Pseudoalteromonas luteoviolacea]TQF71901.1 DUF411 domain-containing protein [Pseudoalteromonas luteoviolacea]